MKINTNSFGNYNASYIDRTQSRTNIEKPQNAPITNSEKNFFAKLYPEKKSEIINYEFYNPKGKAAGITVGSLIDRRG